MSSSFGDKWNGAVPRNRGAIDDAVKELVEVVGECAGDGGSAAEYAVRQVLLGLGEELVLLPWSR